MNHRSMQVRCNLDEPLQLLMDKLASKSSDLYIFWQNYNQLYHAYNQKITEIQRLQLENDQLRKEKTSAKVTAPHPEEVFFKERCQFMQKNVEEFKTQLQKFQFENNELKKENKRFHQENLHLQALLQELRNENTVQKRHIEKILQQLKIAQNQINMMTKVYEEVGQKEMILSRYASNERQLKDQILELEAQIEELNENSKQAKENYQRLLRESMNNAKHKVMESLPGLFHTTKQRVQIIN